MLDQLVESTSHTEENRRKSGLLLTTFVILTTVLLSSWVYSLFAKDYGMGDGELSLQTLVAPPVVEEPPKPEPEEEKPKEAQKDPNVDVRKEAIANMDMTPPAIPDKVSNEKSKIPPIRSNARFEIGDRNSDARNPLPPDFSGRTNKDGTGSDSGRPGGGGDSERGGPPPPPPPPPPVPKKPISGGVLNGKARSLPKPPYPPAARAVRASGAVSVQVVIDEAGNVISASAVSGHPLLRQAAAQAARGAKFSPTMLSGQPVKVQGVITYNFVAP